MSQIYSEEEKKSHLDRFMVSGKTKTEYARENNIPEATFRAWVKQEQYSMFGEIEVENEKSFVKAKIEKPIIFCNDTIRIELKNGYDKKFLKNIIEVISLDK